MDKKELEKFKKRMKGYKIYNFKYICAKCGNVSFSNKKIDECHICDKKIK